MPTQRQPRLKLGFLTALGALCLLGASAPGASAYLAYVANHRDGIVSVINTQTNQVVSGPGGIKVGQEPAGVAITPDGRFAYVANFRDGSVSVINTENNQVVSGPDGIKVGNGPIGIAITPDGHLAYVANFGDGSVSMINTQTNQVVSGPDGIEVGDGPEQIAITPDGHFAYVTNLVGDSVSVINTQTNQVVSGLDGIKVGNAPIGLAITPDGHFAYVPNVGEDSVSVIDTQTNQVISGPGGIKVGKEPAGVAITPDGRFAYVTDRREDSVSVIDTQTNQVISGPDGIDVGGEPEEIAITPDGHFAYVANFREGSVSVINTQTNQVVSAPGGIKVGDSPEGIAFRPDQPPAAFFTAAPGRPGVPVSLDASSSTDPDSAIATYVWSFGDGQSQSLTTPNATHTFAKPGTYQVSLKETDAEGCSTSSIFTGQKPSCNGLAAAQLTKTITVAYPGVGVRCPKSAKPKGCAFKLQAIAKKPTKGRAPKAESLLAKVKLKAGRSTIVSLKPKTAFAAKLASAQRILVKETLLAKGKSTTRYVKLRVVR
ncbi:MAG TPA: beta-propeller fold lactonase family protein [Solirubrobacterales bacterium]|jgi:YVTN family beta-propeller protein|nr:beta-propeller fold lactonase family protein [Solirubrobacterales bacterium]